MSDFGGHLWSTDPLTELLWRLVPGAVELPSYMVGCYLMDRIGRKKTCAPALLLAGVACMLIIVLPAVRTLCTRAREAALATRGFR